MKNILKVILCLLSYMSIMYFVGNVGYGLTSNIFNMLALIPILYLFFKVHKSSKRTTFYALILAIFSGILFSLSIVTSRTLFINGASLINFKNMIKFMVLGMGLGSFFYYFYLFLLPKLKDFKEEKLNLSPKKFFLISFIVIVVSYIPYFLHLYPGVLSIDSYNQIKEIETNIYSNWHPYFHTRLVGLFYNLGKSIFGGANAGVALYVVLQMIFASFIFSVLATYLYKKNIPNVIAYLTVVYFAVSPLHATYSITVWKDIVYGLLMVLIVLNILVFIDNPDSKKHLVYFMILALLSLFFRNNGIYVLIVFIPFMIVYLIINHRQVKGLIVSLGLIILPYFIVSGPVFKLLKVGEAPITEALSIPLNQMARVAYLDGNIDNKEKDYLDKLMDISLVKTSYQQTLADPVKNLTNKEVIDKDRLRFMAVYFTLMPKNLFTYIDSYLYETNGYWSVALVDIPLVGSMEYEPVSSLYNIYHHSLLPHFMDRFFDMTKDFGMPFLQFFYSSGLMFYLLVVSFIISFYKKKNKYWLAYIPLLAVWLTIMMATPIYASARYVYPLFICLPLYLAIPLFKD